MLIPGRAAPTKRLICIFALNSWPVLPWRARRAAALTIVSTIPITKTGDSRGTPSFAARRCFFPGVIQNASLCVLVGCFGWKRHRERDRYQQNPATAANIQ